MGLELHFEPCRFDGTTETRLNPFTKQAQDVARSQPLSSSEVSDVLEVLRRAGASDADEFGCRVIHFADGSTAEVFTDGLERGCMIVTDAHRIPPSLAQLLFDLLVAGSWVLMAEGADDVAAAPSADCVKSAPPAFFGEIVVVASAGEIVALLSGGIGAFQKARAQNLH